MVAKHLLWLNDATLEQGPGDHCFRSQTESIKSILSGQYTHRISGPINSLSDERQRSVSKEIRQAC